MLAVQDWTKEKKEQWFKSHPCKKKNGEISKPHKNGRCMNCGGCIVCEKPPWCTDHRKADNPRKCKRSSLSHLGTILSTEKRPRRQKESRGSAGTISALGMVKIDGSVEEALDLYDIQADKERAEGNKLGNLFMNDLNAIEDLPSTPLKVSRLTTVLQQIIRHLSAGDDEKYQKILTTVVQRLDPTAKQKDKLCKNIATLIIDGSANTRRVANSLLLSSFPEAHCRKILMEANYPERRKEQVTKNKAAINERKKRVAQTAGCEPASLIDVEPVLDFTSPLSDRATNSRHRNNFVRYLSKGKDIPSK